MPIQVQGGLNTTAGKGGVKDIFSTTGGTTDPTLATFCFFCPPDLSLDAFCVGR